MFFGEGINVWRVGTSFRCKSYSCYNNAYRSKNVENLNKISSRENFLLFDYTEIYEQVFNFSHKKVLFIRYIYYLAKAYELEAIYTKKHSLNVLKHSGQSLKFRNYRARLVSLDGRKRSWFIFVPKLLPNHVPTRTI